MEKRDIKFRAWDGEKMIFMHKGQFCLSSVGSVQEVSSTGHELYDRDFPVMQFTGLKDKNGKDIYEGDIMGYQHLYAIRKYEKQNWYKQTNEGKSRVIFSRGKFVMLGVCDLSSLPEIYDSGDNGSAYWESKSYDFEVIGNVHETPELLQNK